MKKTLLLLSFLVHPLYSTTSSHKCYAELKDIKQSNSAKKVTAQKINDWYKNYSCDELNNKELQSIAEGLATIIKEYNGNPNKLETLLADYCHITGQKHLHTQCFSAVVKACEDALLSKYNKPSSFKQTLFGYSSKIKNELGRRGVKVTV